MKLKWAWAICLCFGCYRVPDTIEPHVSCEIQEHHFTRLKSAFVPLADEEKTSDWGKEMVIGHAFADELDLYRALSTYKRASFLIPEVSLDRKQEIQYDILLCYYLGKKCQETVDSFEKSELAHVDKSFPAYHDLLLILYECYGEMDKGDKQQRIYELIQNSFPETGEKLKVSRSLRTGDLPQIQAINESLPHPSYLDTMLDQYHSEKKSVRRAQVLNALLPGAGYLYIGQKKSALTAFLLNGLFVAAAVQFYHWGNIPAAIITTGFEAGWYFGGIYGVGQEAKYYNERAYERNASSRINDYGLFPVLMLQHAF